MKSKFRFPLTIGLALLCCASLFAKGEEAQWNSYGPEGGKVSLLAIAPSAPATLYATGPGFGTLTVTGSAGNPLTASLSGAGLPLQPPPRSIAKLSARDLGFASQAVGTASAAQTLALSNSGAVGYAIRDITASGDFAIAHDCGASVAPGASCALQVAFMPTATGTRTGNLSVDGGAASVPLTASLSGTGAAPAFDVTADLALKLRASKAAKQGNSRAYILTLFNKSKTTVPGVLIKGALGNGAAYSKAPPFCGASGESLTCHIGTLGGNKQRRLIVTIKSSTAGSPSFNAIVSGEANDPNPANNSAAVATNSKRSERNRETFNGMHAIAPPWPTLREWWRGSAR